MQKPVDSMDPKKEDDNLVGMAEEEEGGAQDDMDEEIDDAISVIVKGQFQEFE